jgi:hypothetical protein
MLVYSILIFLLAAVVVLGDKMYDEKYSQPMSDKDNVLGEKIFFLIFFHFLSTHTHPSSLLSQFLL